MNIFNYVKQHVSIFELVSSYTALKKMGGYFKGICPFHNEKTPSFTISPHKDIFYCFGCHESGDVIAFIETAERCSPLQAAFFLIDRYGIELPAEYSAHEKTLFANLEDQRRYWKLMQLVSRWSHEQLMRSPDALSYSKERGFDEHSIKHFMLGYIPGGKQGLDSLLSFLQNHNFLLQDLLHIGLVVKSQNLYSPFADRIVFPIVDQMGRVCALGGRIFQAADDRAKYYNSKENTYFHKGTILYNLYNAKKIMQEKSAVFLVEGYFDCMAMVQHGYGNTIATLGTACTIDHLHAINRYVSTIYVMYDADAAGLQAVLKLARLCWEVALDIRIVQLPSGEDPASLLAQGVVLEPYIAQATDIFLFFINAQKNKETSVDLRSSLEAMKEIFELIKTIDNPVKQELLLQVGAKSLNIDFQAFKKEFFKKSGSSMDKKSEALSPSTGSKPLLDEEPFGQLSMVEKKLFSVIVNNVYAFSPDQLDLLECFNPPLKSIVQQLQNDLVRNPALLFNDFYVNLSDKEKRIVSSLSMIFLEQDHTDTEIAAMIDRFRKESWKRTTAQLKDQLVQAQHAGNMQEINKILLEFQHLKRVFYKVKS